MDLRYIGFKVNGEDVERRIDVGSSANYDNLRTIELFESIKKIVSENKIVIKKIFVGEATTVDDLTVLQSVFSPFIVRKLAQHDDHIHLRFGFDELSRPAKLPSGNLVLAYVPPPPNATPAQINAAIATSTHIIPLVLMDNAGNRLLPWTRITFSPDNNKIIQVRSDHPTQSGKLWANYNNSIGVEGQVILKIQCVAAGISPNPLRLKDRSTGKIFMETVITCQ